MRKFYEEVALSVQPFVMNPEQTVGQALHEAEGIVGAAIAIKAFVRFRTGEGVHRAEPQT